jgi:hypothetical protein
VEPVVFIDATGDDPADCTLTVCERRALLPRVRGISELAADDLAAKDALAGIVLVVEGSNGVFVLARPIGDEGDD